MSGLEPAEELKELAATLGSIEAVLKPDDMRAEVASLETEAADPDLWGDQERAQRVTRKMATLRADLARLDGLHGRLDDLSAAIELGDEDLLGEAVADLPALRSDVEGLEIRTLLAGPAECGSREDRKSVV